MLSFVDSVSETAALRLDLAWPRPDTVRPFLADVDTPPPPLRRLTVDSPLADGSVVGAESFGLRTVRLRVALDAIDDSARHTALGTLLAECLRPRNVIKVRPPWASESRFLLTYRATDASIEALLHAENGGGHVTVEMAADPFALGVRRNLAAVTVAGNPTATNPLRWDIAGVLGDVPAPAVLLVEVTGAATAGLKARTLYLGSRARGTVTALTDTVRQAEAAAGAAPAAVVTDAQLVGGSGVSIGTVTGTAQMAVTTGSLLGGTATEWPGTYRLFARVRKTVAADVFSAQYRLPQTGVAGPAFLLNTSTTTPRVLDLGLFQVGLPISRGYDTARLSADQPTIELWATRVSGTGLLYVDYLIAVPADEATLVTAVLPTAPGTTMQLVIDGVADGSGRCYYTAIDSPAAAVVIPAGGPVLPHAGSPPELYPGVTNRLWLLHGVSSPNVAGDGGLNEATINATVLVKYWPLWLSPFGP